MPKNAIKLTAERLREVLDYDPMTGIFRWKTLSRNGRGHKPGDVAGTNDGKYLRIKIAQVRYRAHRLAWFYMTGSWPKVTIDHKNRSFCDNRFENLREATTQEQALNKRTWRQKKNPLKGVSQSRGRRWQARICSGRRSVHLGMFDTAEEAHAAYVAAAKQHFGDFACSG